MDVEFLDSEQQGDSIRFIIVAIMQLMLQFEFFLTAFSSLYAIK